MKKILQFFLDLIFPVACLGCGQNGTWLCRGCQETIILYNDRPPATAAGQSHLSGVWIAADYENPVLAAAIKSFKYDFIVDIGESLAEILCRYLKPKIDRGEIPDFDYVMPVPLSAPRRIWRGFNQAEILAQKVSRRFTWPLASNWLYRARHCRPQVGLNASDRAKNIMGVFAVRPDSALGRKKILLVDDVFTSGATLGECARVLRQAGAQEVWGLVIANG